MGTDAISDKYNANGRKGMLAFYFLSAALSYAKIAIFINYFVTLQTN
ncbi:unknown [Prevotella sp. CAG:487]|nr:unknown [Prevotella sp. CAG:487]